MFLNQISPAILPRLRSVPVVAQVVTYKAICPRGTKVLPDGRPCTSPAGVACLRSGCVTRQTWLLDMAQLHLLRRFQRHVDRVVALSQAVRRRLEEAGLRDVRVVPNGVPARPARPPLSGPPTVAFAGRLVPEKGVDVLLTAFAEVRRRIPDARLLVAGSRAEWASLASLADRLGLRDGVEFAGHLSRADLEHRFDAAWVQAVPGRWEEPFGNVVTEAMARGTAVVASAVGGPAEVVRPGKTGALVPPGDAAALADALATVLGDRDLAERWGRQGRALALAEYSQDVVLDRFEALYAELVPTSARPVGRARRP